MGASTFSSITLEAEKTEMNYVKITRKKILCTKNSVARSYSPVRVIEIYLRICKDSEDMLFTFFIREKDVKKSSNQTTNESA